ncbi:phage tail protein [Enterobacter sp. HSTU-ASh6]|uniref:phage tail-collar fiber domain-containing protein n=1 Tax=Enterobacter sp. HSTU-ASh6 TaxID=2678687 RepID=UPI00225C2C27|nr:phage tail protein [Enterobacter sp. HSTU-ASh6]MCX4177887.1 phage tail protein [Enterobacter sp. HSTU-ASh6]
MTVKYKTVITKAGAVKLAAATIPNGKKVNFTAMAVGDGGGSLPVPDPNQTKLIKEVWRHALNKISQDKKNKNYVVAELLIPPETGGFWMREMGLYDDTGTLIAVGNMAESYKPALAEGSGRAQTVRMVIMVSDIESVELTIDTSTVMATQDYVDDKLSEHEQSRRHPDATLTAKGFTQLSNATDSVSESVAATPKAVKAAYDLAKGKYTAQDATTAQKGIVQLSSATDSTSEVLAATPKAVKAAYDLANGKYTAQDATTGRKGIVQLSSATNSASETLAATPKAVSAAVNEMKETLGTASGANVVTSMTDTTAGRVPVVGWQGLGSAAQFRMGQVSQFLAYAAADFKEVPANGAGWQSAYGLSRRAQAFMDTSGRFYSRFSLSDVAIDVDTPWAIHYTTLNKPTAADADAVSASYGGTFQKSIIVKGNGASITIQPLTDQQASYLLGKGYNGGNTWYVGRGGANNHVSLYNYIGLNGIVLAEDGSVSINTANGKNVNVTNQIIPQKYDNFDSRYVLTDGATFAGFVSGDAARPYMRHRVSSAVVQLAKSGDSYTKAESDNGYAAKTSVYSKSESDGRFQPKGSYGAPNSASKAANGWWQCGSTGILEQWCQGATMTSETTQTITFPKAFPSACLHVEVGTLNVNNSNDTEGMFQLISKSNTGCVVRANRAYGSVGQVAALIKATGY